MTTVRNVSTSVAERSARKGNATYPLAREWPTSAIGAVSPGSKNCFCAWPPPPGTAVVIGPSAQPAAASATKRVARTSSSGVRPR